MLGQFRTELGDSAPKECYGNRVPCHNKFMLLVTKGIERIRFRDPIVSVIRKTRITGYLPPDHP